MRIHFIGIGGVGMAGLAVLLKARGHDVSGCDAFPSARTRWLEEQGIRVFIGHDPAHVADVDEVILTPAVSLDEPERRAAAGKRVRFRGEVLADLVSACDSIAVCGTHGKTTTSTWIARLLIALGEDVTWCIGGETGDFPVAGHQIRTGRALTPSVAQIRTERALTPSVAQIRTGRALTPSVAQNSCYHAVREGADSTVLVVEADESDGTLAHYHAKTLVVNKLEYDHPDHFKTPDAYFTCFDTARRQAADVIESEALPPTDSLFDPILSPLPAHNRKNARAAIEVALRRGHAPAAIAAHLPAILQTLPDRRFQRVWPLSTSTSSLHLQIYTDYAHHPTEMACAVAMARKVCQGTLRVLFQPHRPSRTKALLADFPAALAEADELVLCPTYMAFEPPVEGGDIADLYKICREERTEGRVFLAQSCEEAWEHARNSMKAGDLTLLLGAGDIIRLVSRVEADLAHPSCARRIWIGAGSNTWKSDLNLSVEYVKTKGPAGQMGAELLKEHPTLCPWMAGIPGTVGGWIKMNAGAFGHSFSEVLEAVKVDGVWKGASECGFAYRHSDIVGEIQDYRLKAQPPTFDLRPDAFLAQRKKFPAGTYGSFFKNPSGDFAGRLLEEAGAKELKVGGAYVWSEHANVIVRGEGATGSDVLALARLMRNRVLFRFGIALEPEVTGLMVETPPHS